MTYSQFLHYHSKLNQPAASPTWHGSIYLPPCSCSSSSSICSDASNTLCYDMKTHSEICPDQLTDLCKFVASDQTSSQSSCLSNYFYLCNKYSLDKDKIFSNNSTISTKKETLKAIVSSDEFQSKFNLLKSDINVLSPLCGTKFVFKHKVDFNIKYHVSCNMHVKYDNRGKTSSKCPNVKQRNCVTTKAIHHQLKCPFFINVYLNTQNFRWFIKPNCNKLHKHHQKMKLDHFSYGKRHLSSTMSKEMKKLNKSNISTSIQQNVLMVNNGVTLPIITIWNNLNSDSNKVTSETKTDAEQLLEVLKNQHNVTYFAMYAESGTTPLLSIKNKSIQKSKSKQYKNTWICKC